MSSRRLRFLHWCVAVAFLTGLGASVDGQNSGIRQNSYKPSIPFADLGRHAKDSSPLGTVDGSVNQSIELGTEGQFNATQPSTAGLDQLQPSPRGGGQRLAAGSSVRFSTQAGARKFVPSQSNAKPSYFQPYGGPSQVATRQVQATSSYQTSLGGLSNSQRSPNASRGVARYQSLSPMRGIGAAKKLGAVHQDSQATSALYDDQTPFERVGDPFQGALATGFERFGAKSSFDRACGDACALRSSGGNDPFNPTNRVDRGSRRREQIGEKPQTRVPDSDTKVQSGEEPKALDAP